MVKTSVISKIDPSAADEKIINMPHGRLLNHSSTSSAAVGIMVRGKLSQILFLLDGST